MKIHKEGYSIILVTMALAVFITTVCAWLLPPLAAWIVAGAAALFVLFVTSFFRSPSRIRIEDPETVFAPADGTVVVVEEVTENEYFNDRRLLVSVFMSLSNVHINWFPVGGRIEYFRHHQGRFLVAWHPKSSEENERTTTVVDMGGCKVLPPDCGTDCTPYRLLCACRRGRRAEYAVRIYQVRLARGCVSAFGYRSAGKTRRQGDRFPNPDRPAEIIRLYLPRYFNVP